jgi:hypothetical protein
MYVVFPFAHRRSFFLAAPRRVACERVDTRKSRSLVSWEACALFVVLVCTCVSMLARPARAAVPSADIQIAVLFGDLPETAGVDVNDDGALTVADVLPTAQVLFARTVAELLPHGLGDQLTYRVTDPKGAVSTETFSVISSDAQGEFVIDDLQVDGNQHVLLHVRQAYTDTGSMLFSGGSNDLLRNVRTVCNPPLLRVTIPVLAGQTSSTTVQCEIRTITPDVLVGSLRRTDAFTPLDIVASLSVPAGTYTGVLHIVGTTDLSGEHEADEIYIAPDVGAILQLATLRRQTTTRQLIGGTIGGLPVAR